jgi:hypothetical protein
MSRTHAPDPEAATTPTTLEPIDPARLDAASGGMKYDESSRQSTNVLDCRGPTCLDSTGKTDVKATMQHKYGVGIERQPLPKGDGGPLPGPKMPGEK